MTRPQSLREMYAALDPPHESGLVFAAAHLPGAAGLRLGRSTKGPALLVALDGVDHDMSSIELKNLSLKPNVTCRTHSADGTADGLFTVCMCTTEDSRLQALLVGTLYGTWLSIPCIIIVRSLVMVLLLRLFLTLGRTCVLGS